MTVYVDNFRAPARVGGISGRWSHLTADTVDELHAFAEQIGLKRAWFQSQCKFASCDPCVHWHYDVVDAKRHEAIRAGARSIDIRELGAIVSSRRAAKATTEESATGATA